MNDRLITWAAAIAIVLVLVSPFVYNAIGVGVFSPQTEPKLHMPAPGSCVEETEFMRANHMMILMHSREEAVQEGIRFVRHSLKNCTTCHTKREEFCDSCHEFLAVKLDCFGCHYYP